MSRVWGEPRKLNYENFAVAVDDYVRHLEKEISQYESSIADFEKWETKYAEIEKLCKEFNKECPYNLRSEYYTKISQFYPY